MALKNLLLISIVLLLIFSCKSEKETKDTRMSGDIVFDTLFSGARLNKIEKLGANKFKGDVLPAFEPVNQSPWYAFGISSSEDKQVEILLNYGKYKHRYIPKLSTDRKQWRTLESSKIKIDSLNNTATLLLDISSKKLYVAAQEIETPEDTYQWIDGFISKSYGINKKVAGKTVLNNNNYVLSYESYGISNSIVLIARQHPPEIPGGTFGFRSFYETLFSDTSIAREFRNQFNIYAFPLLNPDGVVMGNWRHNASGVDLNRDWINFTQPETQAVKDFLTSKIEEGKKVNFALDFHTSHSGPYLLVLDSINESQSKRIIPEWMASINSTSEFEVNPRRRSQSLPYCYNYFFNELRSEAVTYEDGDEANREIINKKAQIYAEELMKILLKKVENGTL